MCCKHYFFKHYIEIQTNQFDGVIIDYLDSNEINAKVYLPLKKMLLFIIRYIYNVLYYGNKKKIC